MDQELRKKAEQKVKAKLEFYTVAIVFFFTTIVLFLLTFALPAITFWLLLPVPIFIMVLGVLYLSTFGLPTRRGLSEDWREEEIQREMAKLYRQQQQPPLPPREEFPETDELELGEMESLEERRDLDGDFV